MLWIRNSLIVLISVGILLLPSLTKAATTTYSMKVIVTMPKGSEGEKPSATMPSNTKISPCIPGATGKVNSISFAVTYNAGTVPDKDVFILLFNPNLSDKFLAFGKQTFPISTVVSPYSDVSALTAAVNSAANSGTSECIYLPRSSNAGGSITETIMNVVLTGAIDVAGTWQVIGIVADGKTVDFDNPTTWEAWDVGTFMIKKPWFGSSNNDCQVAVVP
jgi:hypothetical protein